MLRLFPIALVAVLVAGCSAVGSKSSGSASVFDLRPGTCIVPPGTIKAEVASLQVVSCTTKHTQEVYASVADNAGDNYPGAQALSTFANANCIQQFKTYTGQDYRDSSLFFTYLMPSVRSWAAKDRCVVCMITTTGEPLTSSVRSPSAPKQSLECSGLTNGATKLEGTS